MVVVDTSVWIDFFNGTTTTQTEKLDILLSSTRIIVGDLIIAEILQGFKADKDYRLAKQLLQELKLVSLCNVSYGIKSADNYRKLRKQGITIRKTIDCLIATYCIENKLPLLYSDKDFEPFAKYLKLQSATYYL
ncbi:type II toxin-antitoxin system VapC family toxin [Myxosarcina sp. GI1(2024)]